MRAVEAVATRHGAAYIDAGSNRGFAAGVNIGLRRLDAEDALLVNPDAVVTPDALRSLTSWLGHSGNERVAAVAPRIFGRDGAAQRVAWPFPTPLRACIEAIGLGRLPAPHRFVIGAVLLLRAEALADVGDFDERFFLYAEEADWQRRAYERGWTSAICAEADAQHVSAGTSADPLRRELLFHAAQETYIRKWFGPPGWLLYRAAVCAGAAARAVVLTGERRREAGRRALLYLRGPRRVLSKD
jgi:GT2 family glycosyltransferase